MRTIDPMKIHGVAKAIAQADGCDFDAVIPAIRSAYNDMAVAAIRQFNGTEYRKGHRAGRAQAAEAKAEVLAVVAEMEAHRLRTGQASGTLTAWAKRLKAAFEEKTDEPSAT